jgi:acyl carrier protein
MSVKKISSIVAKIKNDPSLVGLITPETNLIDDIGIDSLDMIDFLLSLEADFDIQVDFDKFDFDVMESVSKLETYISAQS